MNASTLRGPGYIIDVPVIVARYTRIEVAMTESGHALNATACKTWFSVAMMYQLRKRILTVGKLFLPLVLMPYTDGPIGVVGKAIESERKRRIAALHPVRRPMESCHSRPSFDALG